MVNKSMALTTFLDDLKITSVGGNCWSSWPCQFLFDKVSDLLIAIFTNLQLDCYAKVQVSNDQEKAQSEKGSHSKNRGGKKLN